MPTPLWTDGYLDQLFTDAAQQVNDSVNCLYQRMYVTVTSGNSILTLDPVIKKVLRITYRGWKLTPVNWDDLQALGPATAIINNTTKVDTQQGRPYWYAFHPTNLYEIRLFPTPIESLTSTGDPYSPSVNEAKCCIAYWSNIDTSKAATQLPSYIDRRTRKAYVAWKAFEKEGRGQNSKAAQYYNSKYNFLVEQFDLINSGCFVSKRYSLGDEDIAVRDGMKYPRPTLPANFERTIY